MLQDIRFGLKLLWKQKAFSIAALLTLALCIGANTAVFTILKTVVLNRLPFPEAERLVTMYNIYPGVGVTDRGANGVPDYLDRRKLTDVFEEVALFGSRGYDIGSEGATRCIDGDYVTPFKQRVPDDMHIVVRGETSQVPLTNSLRHELAQVDPQLALFDTKTMPERMTKSLLDRRAAMVLCLIFAGLALLLSAIGIYGVLAYSVTQRTREIGIRMALGAETRDVLRMVLGHGVKLTAIGLAIGAVGAFFLTRAMSLLLYDVKPYDPLVFLSMGVLLAAVALIASLIPSLRAVWIRPSEALRHE